MDEKQYNAHGQAELPPVSTFLKPDSPTSRQPKIKKQRFWPLITIMFVVSGLSGFGGGWIASNLQEEPSYSSTEKQVLVDEGNLIAELAEDVGPSVVSVNVGRGLSQGAGTGFIISEDGIVVTNRHVVPEGTSSISLTLSDGTELDDIDIIGRTGEGDSLDVAFLKINDADDQSFKPVKIGDSSEIQIGSRVIAVGNALGQYQNTVTFGIISGFGRDVQARDRTTHRIDELQNLLQTDAAINPGNSGGPLINIDGEVIGINTAVAGEAQNIGFAIPINDVKGMIASVLEDGKFERPMLGVRYVMLNEEMAGQYGLDATEGAFIVSEDRRFDGVVRGSAADRTGLREGDIIIRVADMDVDERNNLGTVIRQQKVGEEIDFVIIRGGREIILQVTLTAAND